MTIPSATLEAVGANKKNQPVVLAAQLPFTRAPAPQYLRVSSSPFSSAPGVFERVVDNSLDTHVRLTEPARAPAQQWYDGPSCSIRTAMIDDTGCKMKCAIVSLFDDPK